MSRPFQFFPPFSHPLTAAICRLFRQLDSIRVLSLAFVFLGKNLFKPMGLMLSDCLIHKVRVVKDDKFLAAMVTPKCAHLCKLGRTLSRLPFLYRYGSHG